MQIQIIAAPDPGLVAAATRRRLRTPVLVARCAGWALLAATVLGQLATGVLQPGLLAGGVVLAVLVPVVLLNGTARRSLRESRVTTYEISDGGIARSSEVGRHAYAWRAFRSVEALSGQLMFGLRGGRWVRVPTTGLSAAEVEQVLGAASAQGLRVLR
ncbi:YcxB family protein [Actinoplanes oblitus]|uniref:YcxB family protein n=1 Tax=Actinoplanes oblitus TaxID=3040509 RepID=A0ABY8WFG8_9ACTN|nr:YcxB family protein [Actinoplanes oblitus]WIM96621.1 YcxB family protein [Actinoplanes oblitus]